MSKEEFKVMSIVLLVILAIIATVLNSLCIVVITKTKVLLKRPSTIFILNLLVVHFIQGALVLPFYAAKKAKVKSPHLSQIICDGFRFTYMVTFYAAVMAVFIICIDRLLATCLVLRYRQIVSRRRAIIIVASAWIYVIALCVIPFKPNETNTSSSSHPSRDNNTSIMTYNDSYSTKPVNKYVCYYQQSSLWTILMLTLNCAIPYLFIVIFYQQIIANIHVIRHRTQRARTMSVANPDNERMNTWKTREQKQYDAITRLAVIMGITYLFFWLPSVIYFVTLRACPIACFPKGYDQSWQEMYIGFFTKYLAFLDAMAAPIIYCVMSGEFRRHIPCYNPEGQLLLDDTRTNFKSKSNVGNHRV